MRWAARRCLALLIAAFPESLPNETLAATSVRRDEQVRAAGGNPCLRATLRDEEPKYGLAVVGTAHPDGYLGEKRRATGRRALPDQAARDGDASSDAAREGQRHEEGLEAAMRSMATWSRESADVLRPFEPNVVTDVTGFGLLGHAHEMAERSGGRIELDAASLPLFPGRDAAAMCS